MSPWLLTPLLLIASNVLMIFAWYGHLKAPHWPIWLAILVSWGIAFFEYCLQVPANRFGHIDHGGPFALVQLKVIQEVVTLVVFTVFSLVFFRHEPLRWNHALAALFLVAAVWLVFRK
jgi:uncharacterized protein (DUF486 family)